MISLGSVTGLVRAIPCNSSMRSSGMCGPIRRAGHGWSRCGCGGIRIRIRVGASLRPCPHHNRAAIMFVRHCTFCSQRAAAMVGKAGRLRQDSNASMHQTKWSDAGHSSSSAEIYFTIRQDAKPARSCSAAEIGRRRQLDAVAALLSQRSSRDAICHTICHSSVGSKPLSG